MSYDLPITHEWLELSSDRGHRTFDGPQNKVSVYMGYGGENVRGCWCACINGAPYACSVRVPTRGALLRLLEALEIPRA